MRSEHDILLLGTGQSQTARQQFSRKTLSLNDAIIISEHTIDTARAVWHCVHVLT